MVLIVTSDGEQFNVDKDVVERSVLIKNMLEGNRLCNATNTLFHFADVGESDQAIPLPNVTSSVFKKVGILCRFFIRCLIFSLFQGARILHTPSWRTTASS